MARMPVAGGFTLVELIAVLAVVALLLGAGLPALAPLVHRTLALRESYRLLTALQLARSEAAFRNTPVSLCPSGASAGGQPACGGDYSAGWVVFANPGRDGRIDPDSDEVIRVFGGLPRDYRLTNRAGDRELTGLVTYLPDGSTRNRTLMLCTPAWPVVASRSVVLNRTGRPRLVAEWGQCQ